MTDDRTLARELSKGSKEAFEVIYMRYSFLVERFVNSLVKDSAVTDDITQNIFMNLWKRRKNLSKEHISFRSYLFTMSRNAVYDWFRGSDSSENVPLDAIDLNGVPSSDISKVVDEKDLLTLINIAISNMPSKRKEIFTMSRVKGMKNAEIAELLNVSVKTVEYHIQRALADLRKLSFIIFLFI